MKLQDAFIHFRGHLTEAAGSTQPTPKEVWDVFKKFTYDIEDADDDFLMVQVGDSEVMGDSYLDFCRELSLSGVDGDKETKQIHAEFKCVLPFKLGYKQTDCSSCDFSSFNEFYSAVEKMPEFKSGLSFSDWSFEVYLEDV